MKKILLVLFSLTILSTKAQVVYEDINNVGIYEFLDELANLKVIEINSVIKPYSRQFIAEKLLEAKEYVKGHGGHEGDGNTEIRNSKYGKTKRFALNKRQVRELEFYLQDYQLDARCEIRDAGSDVGIKNEEGGMRNKESKLTTYNQQPTTDCPIEYDHKLGFLFKKKPTFAVPLNPLAFQYKDKLFTLSVRPILGITYMVNENGSALHKYWGGSIFGYIGKNFGFYASLRDNEESVPMSKREYLTLAEGQIYKNKPSGGVYFSEMRGGITVAWHWGSFGLMNDRFEWGNNYHGANILSGKAPAVPYIHLHVRPVKWLDFNYIHGWLNSDVIDSSRSYYRSKDDYRVVFRNKYIAANMFTITPLRRLNISIGNSIIYSDINVNPLFLIPFMFFNALDATRVGYTDAASSNSQLFFDISSRQIKHLHLWVTLFIDELAISRIFDPGTLNWTSWKAGFKVSDFPLQNISFIAEWTKTNPITYKHNIPATTYTSNNYCLGHYLRDNSQEIYIALGFRPIRGLKLNMSYIFAQHGDEYPDTRDYDYSILRFMKNIRWQNSEIKASARYEYTGNSYFYLQYIYSIREGDIGYQPEFMHGTTNTFMAGVNIGF